MKYTFVIAVFACLLSACSSPPSELKSPCVSADGGPCGPRIKINDAWMKGEA